MINLITKLSILFPDINFTDIDHRPHTDHLGSCEVFGNSTKQWIQTWTYDIPQPTPGELASVSRAAYEHDQLAIVLGQRRKAYPTWEEIHHAQLDGDMDEIQARRQAVKEKYPKPEPYDPEVLYPRGSEYAAIIADGIVDDIVPWSEGIESSVKITDETRDYLGYMPGLSDKFTTIGNIHTVPPGAFISSDKG